ncbi:DUF262 domain-containing protein [Nocardia sp. NPDC049526]|uniref:DUF262 domain-containing protein n=1 Tax=Nocardia sp. NPDC049526 TaxID=3364316 RepID=UPI00379CCE55
MTTTRESDKDGTYPTGALTSVFSAETKTGRFDQSSYAVVPAISDRANRSTRSSGILEGSSQYLVPLYQRPYGWGDEQLQELWNDVIQLAEDRTHEPQATHFIGSVVLAPTPAGVAGAVTRFLVVDGEQRLTTLTLLLAAIRDYLRAVDGSASRDTDRIHNQLLTNQYHDDPDRLKLLPTQGSRPAYTAIIDGSATDDNGNVGSAYRFFRSRLAELTAADDMPFGLSQVVQAVVSGLSVVSISAHPGDNVHRIFQSLNNTGLKLTQGDLLRNYLFASADIWISLTTKSVPMRCSEPISLNRANEGLPNSGTLTRGMAPLGQVSLARSATDPVPNAT